MLTERWGICGEDEDAVSMGVSAVRQLMCGLRLSPVEVGAVQFASQSLLERSKCIKSELMSLLQACSSNVEGVDHLGSDDSSSSFVRACTHWVSGESWDGRWVVAVHTGSGPLTAAAAILVGPWAPCPLTHGCSR